MTNLIYVQAFGKLKLQYRGKWVTHFPTRHVEELAGYLLLHGQMPHSREKLATLLWADHAPDKGRACLSTALWRLRCLLENLGLNNVLHATRDTITLTLANTAVFDTANFESLIARAKTSGQNRQNLLQEAVSLYKDEFCEGIYADWCLLERERLSRQHLWALGQLMNQHMESGEYHQAIEIGHCLLTHDPLREEVHRALMLCHQKAAQHSQALQQFQRCSELLQNELGILPMPETLAIYQQILASRFQSFKPKAASSPELDTAYAEFLRASTRLANLLGN
jgi:DNA-binding SARP family transcriptional activator